MAQPVFPPSFPPRPTASRSSERLREVHNPAPRSAADGSPRLEEIVRIAHDAGHSEVHLVFWTLHTNSAVKTVERVLGMYPPEEQESVRRSLSESLLRVVAQGLI